MNPKFKLWLDIAVLVALVVVAFSFFGGGQKFGDVYQNEVFYRGPVDVSSMYQLAPDGVRGNKIFDGTNWVASLVLSAGNSIIVNGITDIDSLGIMTGVVGGSTHTTLALSTSTTLTGSFDCQYDSIQETTSTAAITLTLPPATSTAANCLTQDGTWETTFINLSTGNSFNVTLATSTGDTLAYNATSTAGGAVLATSTTGSYYLLNAIRFNSSSVAYYLSNYGVGH